MSEDGPLITQKMALHLNMGREHAMHYAIHVDGRETQIGRVRTSDRKRGYLVTSDKLICGDDEFDLKAGSMEDARAWILERAQSSGS